jgi:Tol biopolymer transport system component
MRLHLRHGLTALLCLPLLGCMGGPLRPLVGLNQQLSRGGNSQEPALSGEWLAMLAGRQGRLQVQLLDLRRGLPVPLPGLNRPDSQPISVAVDQQGERLALVRLREGRTELLLYRRSLQLAQPIPIEPAGVPRKLSLSADGRLLALEVSRDGLWQIDLLELP